ncbi:hypothetical protein [uncultured Eubacterium sp.]|uniref:hypothetical protein n=1 Tax=uncultured Eubacterium sp. TaxID=165185 RepID=UPI0025D9750D|nr:hypothetical protein [uncultured Eubacterium sp.]
MPLNLSDNGQAMNIMPVLFYGNGAVFKGRFFLCGGFNIFIFITYNDTSSLLCPK